MKLYSCRFAPCGRDPLHAVRAGQPVWSDGRSVKECFHPDAFAGTPTAEVPVLISHDTARRAGSLVVKVAAADWHVCDFVLDGPYAAQGAELIARSGKVSPGFTGVDKDPYSARPPSPMDWYLAATLDEISLLEPGEIAGYQGAEVTRSVELAAPKPKPPPATPEVIHTPPLILRQPARSQELDEEVAEFRRRQDWHEAHGTGATVEAILEAMKRELNAPRAQLRLVG